MNDRVSSALREFFHWWGGELKGLLPAALREPLAGRRPRVLLSLETARLQVLGERSGRTEILGEFPADEGGREEAALRLAEAVRTTPGAAAGLRLGAGSVFIRRVELPAAARKDFARILELDLEQATPFRREDILLAHYLDEDARAAAGKIVAAQAVARRRQVDPPIRRLEELGVAVAFVDCWNASRSCGAPINFLSATLKEAADTARRRALTRALAAVAAGLAASALVILYVRCGDALASLDEDVARTKAEAQVVRQALARWREAADRRAAVERLARSRAPMALALDRLTALLPDTAWVYDLRIDGQTVEISGFAKSAAALIPLIERSETFTEATLTAPVVLEGGEDKERFSLRARLRGAGPPAAGREEP